METDKCTLYVGGAVIKEEAFHIVDKFLSSSKISTPGKTVFTLVLEEDKGPGGCNWVKKLVRKYLL